MACGTGKTVVGAVIVEELHAKRIVVFVPSIALVRQAICMFRQAGLGEKRRFLALCSDRSVADQDEDDVVLKPAEIEAPLLREGSSELLGKSLICFCTYQSAESLRGFNFDLAIFDEAHRTAGRRNKLFGFALDDKNVFASKRIFMTATPRYEEDLKEAEGALVHSMNDQSIYGEVAHSLSYKSAVEKGLICDYEVLAVAVRSGVDKSHKEAVLVAIEQAAEQFGVSKAFSYHGSVAQALHFTSEAKRPSGWNLFHVNGQMDSENRHQVLSDFSSRKLALVSNVHCLSEGVDVPEADLAIFHAAKSSRVDIVQTCGRVVRNCPGKSRGYIMLPVMFDENTDADALIGSTRFSHVTRVLRALKDQDESLADALPSLTIDGGGRNIPHFTIVGPGLEENEIARFREAVIVRLIASFSRDPKWKKKEILRLAMSSGRKPSVKMARNQTEKTLATAFAQYNSKGSACYDATFIARVKEVAPFWFPDWRISERTKELRRRALAREPRPDYNSKVRSERQLAIFLADLHKRRTPEDSQLIDELADACPNWFKRTRGESYLKELLALAENRVPRPSQKSSDLHEKRLASYLTKLVSTSHPIVKQLKRLVPLWFKGLSKIARQAELKRMLADPNFRFVTRPVSRDYGYFKALTNPKSASYDPDFDKYARRCRPDLFMGSGNYQRPGGLTLAMAKEILLRLARAGKPQPRSGTKLQHWMSYLCYAGGRHFDPKFARRLKKLNKNWFPQTDPMWRRKKL